jgi:Zn-finger nucleic acid-binding protein
MSVANLGHSAGSKIYGMVAGGASYVESYMMLGLFVLIMIAVLFFHRHRHDPARQTVFKPAAGFATGGGAGVFFTGALRCPKCRADMEQIDIDGTIIDRCASCKGIWFDEGELESLSNSSAAATIDTGATNVGRQTNQIDDYRCPRCGGKMAKKVDSQQTHIWYETCIDCNGSFFDAGEFRDLSEITVSDFFKRLVKPKRKI